MSLEEKNGEKSEETVQNVENTLGQNVVVGEKAIVYFYHRPDGRGVVDDIAKHNFTDEFVDWAVKTAQTGIAENGWNFKPDTDRHAAGKKGYALWECAYRKNGGPRLYVQRTNHKGKELNIVFVAGDKSTQNEDFDRAYRRIKNFEIFIERGEIDMHANIDKAISDAENKEPPEPVASHEYKDWRLFAEKNRKAKQRK